MRELTVCEIEIVNGAGWRLAFIGCAMTVVGWFSGWGGHGSTTSGTSSGGGTYKTTCDSGGTTTAYPNGTVTTVCND